MTVQDKAATLEVLNGLVALNYLMLSVGFAATLMLAYVGLYKDHAVGDLHPVVVAATIIGAALFLAGCGIHHAHLALEVIPESVGRFNGRSLWAVHWGHHVIISAAQVVGGWMFLGAGGYVARRVLRR